jgi:leader peptidase (prepilin peptidase)/N-methyltransferase
MILIFGTIFAGLMGLAFGSFLNVCLSRWPEGESIVRPGSHCRQCGRTLAWWENLPLLSWLALRGRCRTCRAWIGWRYPLVELSVGVLWVLNTWKFIFAIRFLTFSWLALPVAIVCFLGPFTFLWLLVALAALDAENLWLPDKLTLPGALGGVFVAAIYRYFFEGSIITPITFANFLFSSLMQHFWLNRFLSILAAAGLILLIRWIYWLIRRREGMGLGDAKLMALLAAWLGLPQALLAFVVGVMLGALGAMVVLAVPKARRESESWAASKLPLGTFLCIGGIVSSLWGQPILDAYLRWAGL